MYYTIFIKYNKRFDNHLLFSLKRSYRKDTVNPRGKIFTPN